MVTWQQERVEKVIINPHHSYCTTVGEKIIIIVIFLSKYFFVHPLELLYQFYDIRQKLVNKPSIIDYFPRTFYTI